eukprot:TRINITY_DN11988_c0_g1_i1.p1 TRINITY_DN11988_c0_g1~~TRINITY_DN11988_c0_g1_i1.p1  ORF type:complete len:684 (-),score=240.74 TRINITY_DN11988_c0_g1_i1:25-1914(-)
MSPSSSFDEETLRSLSSSSSSSFSSSSSSENTTPQKEKSENNIEDFQSVEQSPPMSTSTTPSISRAPSPFPLQSYQLQNLSKDDFFSVSKKYEKNFKYILQRSGMIFESLTENFNNQLKNKDFESKQKIDSVLSDLQIAKATISTLTPKLESLTKKHDENKSYLEKLSYLYSQLDMDILVNSPITPQRNEKKAEEINNDSDRSEDFKKLVPSFKALLSSLQNEKQENLEKITFLSNSRDQIQRKHDEIREILEKANATNDSLHNKLSEIQMNVENLNKEKSEIINKNQQYLNEMNVMKADIVALQDKYDDAKVKLSKFELMKLSSSPIKTRENSIVTTAPSTPAISSAMSTPISSPAPGATVTSPEESPESLEHESKSTLINMVLRRKQLLILAHHNISTLKKKYSQVESEYKLKLNELSKRHETDVEKMSVEKAKNKIQNMLGKSRSTFLKLEKMSELIFKIKEFESKMKEIFGQSSLSSSSSDGGILNKDLSNDQVKMIQDVLKTGLELVSKLVELLKEREKHIEIQQLQYELAKQEMEQSIVQSTNGATNTDLEKTKLVYIKNVVVSYMQSPQLQNSLFSIIAELLEFTPEEVNNIKKSTQEQQKQQQTSYYSYLWPSYYLSSTNN